MDIHLFLQEWNAVEPGRCSHLDDDFWSFTFKRLPANLAKHDDPDITLVNGTHHVTCDVISVRGVGIIEDLIKESIEDKTGWSYALNFDREEELFMARVTTGEGIEHVGLESLNPGIAFLSAYLNSIKNTQLT